MNIKAIELYINEIDQIFNLLKQLTDSSYQLDIERYKNIIFNLPKNHRILLYVDEESQKILGMITVIIEQKLIHNGACVAHIEDLVVDKEYRKQGIAKELLDYTIEYAKKNDCYKIILDCDKSLIPFYEKSGLKEKETQMAMYFY